MKLQGLTEMTLTCWNIEVAPGGAILGGGRPSIKIGSPLDLNGAGAGTKIDPLIRGLPSDA